MINAAICAARSAWYAATEPARLRWERRHHAPVVGRESLVYDAYGLDRGAPSDPLVTCYVPTYNRVDLLMDRALPSMQNQIYTNLEIIVAAHGCTDGTAQRVVLEGQGDPRLQLVLPPRTRTYPPTVENHWLAGPVVPANAALQAARGAWIARIDDDDVWTPDHIEKLLRFAQRGDYEFVSAAYSTSPAADGSARVVFHDGGEPLIGGVQTWMYRSYLKFMRYNPDCWRKSWNAVNDTDLADRFRKAGVRIGWFNDIVAYVNPRPGETTVGLEAYRRDAEAKEEHFAF